MKSVHFVGVSGIGMSAAADITLHLGIGVSGSAIEENEQTRRLINRGMKFYLGHRREQIQTPDAVVVSAAVPDGNMEVLEAKRRGIRLYLYAEYLGMLMAVKKGIAVAGTHGKTTTTAMLAGIFTHAGLDPTAVCGGVMKEAGSNALCGHGDYFIAEACEFHRSFLSLIPWFAVITNIEPEHLDYYSGIDEIKSAFREFLQSTDERGFSVVNGDDRNVREIITTEIATGRNLFTVGYGEENQYKIEAVHRGGGLYTVHLSEKEKKLLSTDLFVPGSFNCINAALAAVVALNIGISIESIKKALENFIGTERRFDYLGNRDENPVYSDYAHHPTEIRHYISALKETYPSKKIVIIFQPHQYSRTLLFFNEFISVLQNADIVILTEVYRQRDEESSAGSVTGFDLCNKLREYMHERVQWVARRDEIISFLRTHRFKDAVVTFMGAGDIDAVAREYMKG